MGLFEKSCPSEIFVITDIMDKISGVKYDTKHHDYNNYINVFYVFAVQIQVVGKFKELNRYAAVNLDFLTILIINKH
jgi:hypothetical protein